MSSQELFSDLSDEELPWLPEIYPNKLLARLPLDFSSTRERRLIAQERSFAMITSDKVVGYSLCVTVNNTVAGAVQTDLLINGVENVGYKLVKPQYKYSAAKMFDTPLEVNAGDRINFITRTNNSAFTHSLVSLLIEKLLCNILV